MLRSLVCSAKVRLNLYTLHSILVGCGLCRQLIGISQRLGRDVVCAMHYCAHLFEVHLSAAIAALTLGLVFVSLLHNLRQCGLACQSL